jgi:hypothetical protein
MPDMPFISGSFVAPSDSGKPSLGNPICLALVCFEFGRKPLDKPLDPNSRRGRRRRAIIPTFPFLFK